jgi:LysR family nitrogen assimilation transcriptional regulator
MLFNEAAQSIGHSVSPAYEIDSRTQIKTLVLRGLGYGILPWMSIRKETEAGIFNAWHITDPIVTRTLYLAYSTERPLSNATKAICDLSWDVLRQLVQDRKWMAKLTSDSGAALRLVES